MSKEERIVSLWVGRADTADALEEYLTFHYTEDDDCILPPFARDFGIGWFDEDFREAMVVPPSRSLRDLITGFSFARSIIPRFIEVSGETLDTTMNAVVLLYGFNYDGHVSAVSSGSVQLRFLGAVCWDW